MQPSLTEPHQVEELWQHGPAGVIVIDVELAHAQALVVLQPLPDVCVLVLHGQAHGQVLAGVGIGGVLQESPGRAGQPGCVG